MQSTQTQPMNKSRRRKLSQWWPKELSRFEGTICLTVSFRVRTMMRLSVGRLRPTKGELVSFLIAIVILIAIQGHLHRSALTAADQLLLVWISLKLDKKAMRSSKTIKVKREEKRPWWTLVATIVSRLQSARKEHPMAPMPIGRLKFRWCHLKCHKRLRAA